MVNPQSSRLREVNSSEFHAYCMSLAKRIDGYIWNNEVPGNTQELASTLIKMGQRRCDDDQTKAVIMMLMMSVKSACELGWFPEKESQQLLALVDSLLKSFTNPENGTSSLTPNGSVSLIPQVMERFYPFLKLGHILVSSEADAESMPLVKPFHISKNIVEHSPRPRPRVGLFVFRKDDISNSSCIIHPQEVSFLLNGSGIDKRHINSMDSKPQRPTNLYKLLISGTNLLQTIGCFGGSYFIVIALLDEIPLPVYPSLKDYVRSEVTESNSACDIPKGPSKISLSCPISRKRIKLPVKGHVCKHLQCFDFWNYIKINTRIPSWCCPHCHQSVCYTDIRLDQSMIKILKEVGSNVTEVVISPDGSWKVVTEESDENVDATHQHVDLSSSQYLRPAVLLNQSSASMEALPQLPQTLNVYDVQQQQYMNSPVTTAGEIIHMPFLPTSSPQDRIATNTRSSHISMPAADSSQYQGLHVSPLGLALGRDSSLIERWNHNYGNGITQTQLPSMSPQLHHQYTMQNQRLPTRSVSPVQERQIPSSLTYPQTLAFNYGEQFSSRESMNMTPDNSANRPPQIRMMRGSITPGSTRYDHLIIQPTQRPVQSQAQTLPPTQPTAYNPIPVQTQAQTLPPIQATAYSHVPVQSQAQTLPPSQAFYANPSYPVGTSETQAGIGSFWSMPPETW